MSPACPKLPVVAALDVLSQQPFFIKQLCMRCPRSVIPLVTLLTYPHSEGSTRQPEIFSGLGFIDGQDQIRKFTCNFAFFCSD
jgi:hypothetical protein